MRVIVALLATLVILILEMRLPPNCSAAKNSPGEGKAWAVVIGINDYQKTRRLHYAIEDATAIGNLLEQEGFTVIRIVLPQDANRKNIEYMLGTQLPKQFGGNDRVLVFFSGHGQDVPNGEGQRMGYLLPVEADPEDLASTAISMGRVREWANFWSAKHVLFIVDSCYSGIIGEQTKSPHPPMSPSYLQQITMERGRHLITAGGADQEALEVGEWGHSLLTHLLLEGLRDKTADLNSDGIIPTSELYQFLDRRVFDEAILKGHRQRPEHWLLSPGQKGEFVFAGRKTPLSPLAEQQVTLAKVPTLSLPTSPSSVPPAAALDALPWGEVRPAIHFKGGFFQSWTKTSMEAEQYALDYVKDDISVTWQNGDMKGDWKIRSTFWADKRQQYCRLAKQHIAGSMGGSVSHYYCRDEEGKWQDLGSRDPR